MNVFKNDSLIGEKIGKLFVIKFLEYKNNHKYYLCKCDCGNTHIASDTGLISGQTKCCSYCRENNFKDITGNKYGSLTVIKRVDDYVFNGGKISQWLCKCDCGKETIVRGDYLRSGHTQSCGCLRGEHSITHRESNTKLYNVWNSIKSRCFNPNSQAANDYGNRGITMCEEWYNDYTIFRDWAFANGYDPKIEYKNNNDKLTVERINVNGNYCPENCKLIPLSKQNENKRNNIRYEFNGKKLLAKEWAEETGIPLTTINSRLARGWSIDKILTTNKIRETGMNNTQYEINGEFHNIYEWSKIYNIDPNVVRSRISGGWNIEKALTEPVINNRNIISYNECTGTIAEWARALMIPSHIIQYRLAHGWSEESTLTTPIKDKGGHIKYPMAGIYFIDEDGKPISQDKIKD